jgi:hypothetical protein
MRERPIERRLSMLSWLAKGPPWKAEAVDGYLEAHEKALLTTG